MVNDGSCAFHPGVDAVTFCARCHRPLCAACKQYVRGNLYCPSDAEKLTAPKTVQGAGSTLPRTPARRPTRFSFLGNAGPFRWASRLLLGQTLCLILGAAYLVILLPARLAGPIAPSTPTEIQIQQLGLATLNLVVAALVLRLRPQVEGRHLGATRFSVGLGLATFAILVASLSQGDVFAYPSILLQFLILGIFAWHWDRLVTERARPVVKGGKRRGSASLTGHFWNAVLRGRGPWGLGGWTPAVTAFGLIVVSLGVLYALT